jgi:hypothetical protein
MHIPIYCCNIHVKHFNMHMKHLKHLKYTLATCQARHSSGRRPPRLASLKAVTKYGMATTPLPSLAVGGGEEEDAGANTGDETTDVRERDLVLLPVAEAIRGYKQHHGLRELGEQLRGSGHRGHDGEGRAKQDEGRGGSEGHDQEKQEAGANEG